MARDYKHRAQITKNTANRRRHPQANVKLSLWKWMLITALIIAFAVFLLYLRTMSGQAVPVVGTIKSAVANSLPKTESSKKTDPKVDAEAEAQKKLTTPQFDFYTILPKKEVVIADHEIKARVREERVGKVRDTHYVIQAGSFKLAKEAEQLQAKLALMGIESKINKAKVGDVIWFRVKIGPYARLDSVNTVMDRLQQNDMRPVVTELENQ